MNTHQILTPENLESRLSIVTPDFKKVIAQAKAERKNVHYVSRSTPFGTYPMSAEVTAEKVSKQFVRPQLTTL